MAILESHERIGSLIEDRYEIVRILGEGGMGVVFEGRELRLDRRVAIKLLHPHLASNPELRARFIREAQAAATLEHENVVRVYAVGSLPDGASYIVMEFLDGESLATLLERRGVVDPVELHALLAPAMDAIAYAHSLGIVHRDIKPDNIFLAKGARGIRTKVVDFGIAKVAGTGQMTATNSMLGTPLYMSPEQIQGSRDVGATADVWSMGVVVYQALTGAIPFDVVDHENPLALLAKVMLETPIPIEARLSTVSPGFAAMVNRALAKDVRERYADMGEFLSAFTDATKALADRGEVGAWGGAAFARTFATPVDPRVASEVPRAVPVALPSPTVAPLPIRDSGKRVLAVVAVVGLVAIAGAVAANRDASVEPPPAAQAVAVRSNPIPDGSVQVARDAGVAAAIEAPAPAADTPPPPRTSSSSAGSTTRRESGSPRASTTSTPASMQADSPRSMDEPANVPRTDPSRTSEPRSCFREVGNGVRIRVPCP